MRTLQHPARLLPLAFLTAIGITTALLMLPAARADSAGSTDPVTAVFTATSAICVTGLTVVEPAHWSQFGHIVIIAAVKVGGYGIMTSATLLSLLVARRLGLRTRLLATAEGRSLDMANVRGVLFRVALTQTAFELLVAAVLALRWWSGYRHDLREAIWEGIFHGISAFNNGGFAFYSDSLARFTDDYLILGAIGFGVIAGSLGFPVLFELFREFGRPRQWTLHTKLTVYGSAALLLTGFVALLGFEWRNPATFGAMPVHEKLMAAFFNGAMPRSGGFSSVAFSDMLPESTTVTSILMFIGGGSASTAGGIKISTFLVLGSVIWSEIRGEPDVTAGRRRIPAPAQREAMSVALLGVALIALGTLLVEGLSNGYRFEHILFDVISAFATVGLSTGVTPLAPDPVKLVLAALMFIGRIGPVVLATGLALNTRLRHYRYPQERPIVGG